MLLLELLSDLIKIDDVSLIVKNNGALSEIRSDSLSIRQKDKWITIGDNDGPAHIHLNSELIKFAEFIQEQKPEKISFSVQFFNESGERVFAAFFIKMYDDSKQLIIERKKLYDQLNQKFTSKINF